MNQSFGNCAVLSNTPISGIFSNLQLALEAAFSGKDVDDWPHNEEDHNYRDAREFLKR